MRPHLVAPFSRPLPSPLTPIILNHRTTYLILLGLTGLSVLVAQGWLAGPLLPFLLMTFAAAKFLLVSFRFMDLRRAHPAWKIGFTGLLLTFLVIFLPIA